MHSSWMSMGRHWTVTGIYFAAVPHTEHACSDSGEENSLLTGRNLQQNQAQCERPSATTDWGFERTEQRQQLTGMYRGQWLHARLKRTPVKLHLLVMLFNAPASLALSADLHLLFKMTVGCFGNCLMTLSFHR
ncbi:hypothetical protein AMECASPLE_014066 [Ameca splendens]|uniref:Secreted protein n=1 Tax=Ameca splendens TaxID=208324 RepID=A0ABV0Z0P0_9TELE